MPLKISIIGCGAIGKALAQALTQGVVPGARLVALCDQAPERARALAVKLHPRPRAADLVQALTLADLVVEAAGMAAVPGIAAAALASKKDLLVMSIGALLETPAWFQRFEKAGVCLHFPSGAVAGLDALKAAAVSKTLKRVCLTTRKPPQGLAGAPFFQRKKLDPHTLTTATLIFAGSARTAVRLFPANVNVAAAVALAGLGPERTRVKIFADPGVRRNSHTLEAEGGFGRLTAITENVPAPDNPKTSQLAAYSALALIQSLASGSRKGT